jgi:hypothetical protein
MRPLAIAMLVLAVGCGGSDTFRDVFTRLAEVACAKQQECQPPAPAGCVASYVDSFCAAFPDCDAEIGNDDGQVDSLDTCISDYEALSCAAVEEGQTPASCGLF